MNEVDKKCVFKFLFQLIPRERGIFAVKEGHGWGSLACEICQYGDCKKLMQNVSMELFEIIINRGDGLKVFRILESELLMEGSRANKKNAGSQRRWLIWAIVRGWTGGPYGSVGRRQPSF